MAQAEDTAWLPVLPSMKGFGPALIKGAGAESDKAGKSVGQRFGKALIVGTAAVGAAAVGAGVALYKVGEIFDEVTDTIRVGSGASGAALDDLVASAKNIGTKVPADFDKIGTVVADVSTRMGLTGEAMETVASQYLEAGRILGEDVDVGKTSAAFNAFKIEGDNVSGAMDHLFQVSQATGMGMNELADAASRNAPAMQTLGFSFEETTAMVGSFDKAGLNSSAIMASMSKGLVTLAKDGEEPAAAFKRVQGEIAGFIEKGDKAGALNLASKVFGTRGATQFIGAIESGALSLDDMSKAGGQTGDTILGLGEETLDFAEQWMMFKNKILVWLEPMSARVFGAMGTLMGEVTDGVTAFGAAWEYNDGEITSSGIPGLMERLGFYARQAFDYITLTAIPALQRFGQFMMDNRQPIGIIAGVITALLLPAFVRMGVRALVAKAQIVGTFIAAKAAAVSAGVSFVLQSIKIVGAWALMGVQSLIHGAKMAAAWILAMGPIGWIIVAVVALVALVIANWGKISKFTKEAWANIVKFVTDAWTNIKNGVAAAIEWVRAGIASKVNAIKALWSSAWNTVRDKVNAIWAGIKTGVSNAIESVRTRINDKLNAVKTLWSNAWNVVKDKVSGVFNGIKSTIDSVWKNGIKPIFDTIGKLLKGDFVGAFQTAKDAVDRIWRGVANIVRKPINFVIGTVYNKGIKAVFDKVAGVVGIKAMPNASEIPAFAKGGQMKKGWKLVGEEGPELINTGPGFVHTAKETQAMLAGKRQAPHDSLGALSGPNPSQAMLPNGGILSTLKNVWDKGMEWVRGGLAKAAALVINPIKDGLRGALGSEGFGGMISGAASKILDGSLSWLRGKDDEVPAGGGAAGSFDGPKGRFHRPSAGPFTSMFGPRWGAFHAGVDIAGGGKTFAALNGLVKFVGKGGGLPGRTGHGIRLDHGGGFETYYGHNPYSGVKVRPGQQVKAGQHIGYQGNTGNVTGTHLHFETLQGGRPHNPMKYLLRDQGGVLPPGLNAVLNNTGGNEWVFNQRQLGELESLAQQRMNPGGGDTYNLGNVGYDPAEIFRQARTEKRRAMVMAGL